MLTGKRVIMALSGGVDSSVAAALLKEAGYEVLGFYILGWPGDPGDNNRPCSWQADEADARSVADVLGIPFHTVNLTDEYRQQVFEPFLADFRAV